MMATQDEFDDDDIDEQEARQLRRMDEEYWGLVQGCVQTALRGLGFEPFTTPVTIRSSVMFSQLDRHEMVESYQSATDDLQVSLMEYPFRFSYDHYLLGYLPLQKDYPLTCIYRETIKDKIVDFFVKGDVDFKEHKAFSKRFHVVTKDRELLTRLLYNKPLDDLVAFPDMLLELEGNTCIFRVSPHAINDSDAAKFADLVKTIRKIFR